MPRDCDKIIGCRRSLSQLAHRQLREANDDHQPDGTHINVSGNRERATGLARATQVEGRQDDDEGNRDGDLVTEQCRNSRRDVVSAGRN